MWEEFPTERPTPPSRGIGGVLFWVVVVVLLILAILLITPGSIFPPKPTPTVATNTSTRTNTSTLTPSLTSTFTFTPTATATFTATSTNTATPTPTNTPTYTATNTYTPTATPTNTLTFTPTFTNTTSNTFTPTDTATFTSTFTPSETPTETPTENTIPLTLAALGATNTAQNATINAVGTLLAIASYTRTTTPTLIPPSETAIPPTFTDTPSPTIAPPVPTQTLQPVAITSTPIMASTGTPILMRPLITVDNATYVTELARTTRNSLALAWSPDGLSLAVAEDRVVWLYPVSPTANEANPLGASPRSIAVHDDTILAVAFSPDGTILATGSRDDTVRLWDVSTGTQLAVLQGHNAGGLDEVRSVAFSPDGTILASGGSDSTIILWDVARRERKFADRFRHDRGLRGLAFSPDGTKLASASEDVTVRLWDVNAGTPIATLIGHDGGFLGANEVRDVAWSNSGQLASVGFDGRIIFWDNTKPFIAEPNLGHAGLSLSFSPDATLLVVGVRDQTLWLWDANARKSIVTIIANMGESRVVRFDPLGRFIAVAGADGTVRLWGVKG